MRKGSTNTPDEFGPKFEATNRESVWTEGKCMKSRSDSSGDRPAGTPSGGLFEGGLFDGQLVD